MSLQENPGARAWTESDAGSACRFVQSLVAAAFGLRAEKLRSADRGTAGTALARQIAIYLSHVELGFSLSEVGRQFGRDRTTVAHACALVEDLRDDGNAERVIASLEAATGHSTLR